MINLSATSYLKGLIANKVKRRPHKTRLQQMLVGSDRISKKLICNGGRLTQSRSGEKEIMYCIVLRAATRVAAQMTWFPRALNFFKRRINNRDESTLELCVFVEIGHHHGHLYSGPYHSSL